MNSESKSCKKCHSDFNIASDDVSYYERIGVCHPDLCPECRAQLRLSFRNERVFYKRKCDKCGKDAISMYSANKPYPVWCYECWWADDWDPRDYAQDYNPDIPFFEQWNNLFNQVPKPALVSMRGINCEYLNYAADNKDCYMIVESSNNENCTHCYWIQLSKDLVDCSFTQKVERSYESDDCYDSYGLQGECILSNFLRGEQYSLF
jgi:Zn ribbon nucleic-acid-binding protein